jgi:hypothetical protein
MAASEKTFEIAKQNPRPSEGLDRIRK